VAKQENNFIKFGKLASIVKKLADENPDLKEQILLESESTSNNSWNKIQSWTSKQLFQTYKEKPLSDFTEKKVEKFLSKKKKGKKASNCFNIFKIPKADIGQIEVWDLENTLMDLPKNLQIQIDLEGGVKYAKTGINKIKDLPFIGQGDLTSEIRDMYPDLNDVVFKGMRKRGKKEGDRSNCSYYLKVMFIDDLLTPEEAEREVMIGVNLKDLSPRERKQRIKQKQKTESILREKRKKLKEIKPPKKVVSKTVDEEIESKLEKQKEKKAGKKTVKKYKKKDVKTERIKEFNEAVKNLKSLLDEDIITKEQFRSSFDKLNNNLRKGGVV